MSDDAHSEAEIDPRAAADSGRIAMWLVVAIVAGISVPSLWNLLKPAERDLGLEACEREIKATLRAPSTYQRVSATSGPQYFIEYDAQNGFGVPMRGSGMCDASTPSLAAWTEFPRESDMPLPTYR